MGWLATSSNAFFEVAPWIGLLVLFIVAGGVILMAMRRHVGGSGADDPAGNDFTLEGLRKLHSTGMLTDAEFKQAKAALIERMRANLPVDG